MACGDHHLVVVVMVRVFCVVVVVAWSIVRVLLAVSVYDLLFHLLSLTVHRCQLVLMWDRVAPQLVVAHVWLCVGSEAVMMLLQKENMNCRMDGVSFVATQSLHMTLVKDVPKYVYDAIRRA
jgi:hypothetical protein